MNGEPAGGIGRVALNLKIVNGTVPYVDLRLFHGREDVTARVEIALRSTSAVRLTGTDQKLVDGATPIPRRLRVVPAADGSRNTKTGEKQTEVSKEPS